LDRGLLKGILRIPGAPTVREGEREGEKEGRDKVGGAERGGGGIAGEGKSEEGNGGRGRERE